MVSTRSSSRADSLGPDSPTTPTTPASRKRNTTSNTTVSRTPNRKSPSSTSSSAGSWSHTPDAATLLWMAVSLPLVTWDTIYVLGRPHTMEGGWMHRPFWSPYKLYGEVDHVYGWKSFNANNGFTAAQGMLNVFETLMYAAYMWMFYYKGAGVGRDRVLTGRAGGLAVLVGFSAAVMTLSKTILYWLNEYYSGFDNIGHNDFMSLLFLWIIPNGAWLVGSAWMIFSLGDDILQGLEMASSHSKRE